MILTNCAACAAPLAHNAPRCVRCHTRYCNKTCQHDHWRRGHKQICKKIHRGGNAEQYHADKKYKEAVAVAVEACADNYALSLLKLRRLEEAKSWYRKIIPVARRVLGENDSLTLNMRSTYPEVICRDPGATIDDLHEAVTTLEDMEPTVRRVLGGAHPLTVATELRLQLARAVRAREEAAQCDVSSVCEGVTAMMKGDA